MSEWQYCRKLSRSSDDGLTAGPPSRTGVAFLGTLCTLSRVQPGFGKGPDVASYQIVCATKQPEHRHIVKVGTGTADVVSSGIWSIEQVRRRLEAGDRFYTIDSKGREADVERYTCLRDDCGFETVRTEADATTDNNLDQIRNCRI